MIHLAPFEDITEHHLYCEEAGVPFEEGAVGFKIFSDDEKMGLCQIKFVSGAAYILNLTPICDRISIQMLSNVFSSILAFLQRVEIESVVYPVQSESDVYVAENSGFDKVSETLYIFDFQQEETSENEL